jgi:hypothetical protein
VTVSTTFDVYGRFRVLAERSSEGAWSLFRLGSEGKRLPLTDVIVAANATVAEVQDALEAAYHELGAPGRAVRQVT